MDHMDTSAQWTACNLHVEGLSVYHNMVTWHVEGLSVYRSHDMLKGWVFTIIWSHDMLKGWVFTIIWSHDMLKGWVFTIIWSHDMLKGWVFTIIWSHDMLKGWVFTIIWSHDMLKGWVYTIIIMVTWHVEGLSVYHNMVTWLATSSEVSTHITVKVEFFRHNCSNIKCMTQRACMGLQENVCALRAPIITSFSSTKFSTFMAETINASSDLL